MGANNLYFPSVGQTKSIKAKNYMVIDNERTGQPYKIYIEDFVSSLLSEGILVVDDELTADELAAINGSNSPSALNVFATINDLPTDTHLGNTNLTLTGNRTITGGGYTLTFDNLDTFSVKSKYSSSTSLLFNFLDSTNASRASLSAYGILQINPEAHGLTGINFRQSDSIRNGIQAVDETQILLQGVSYLNLTAFNGDLTIKTENAGDVIFKSNNVLRAKISNAGTFSTISPSASSLDTAFAVRNNTDTYNVLQVLGNSEFILRNDLNTSNTFRVSRRLGNTTIDLDTQGTGVRMNFLALNGTYSQGAIEGNNGLTFYSEGSVDAGIVSGAFQGGKFGLKPFLKASLPSVTNPLGDTVVAGVILVTDATPRPTICYSNGTNWIDIQTGVAVV